MITALEVQAHEFLGCRTPDGWVAAPYTRFTLRPATPTIGPGCLFSDVCPSDFFFTPVQSLVTAGAISGYGDNALW